MELLKNTLFPLLNSTILCCMLVNIIIKDWIILILLHIL